MSKGIVIAERSGESGSQSAEVLRRGSKHLHTFSRPWGSQQMRSLGSEMVLFTCSQRAAKEGHEEEEEEKRK